MTDKEQIMINGVDVSGCIHLDKYFLLGNNEEFKDCALSELYYGDFEHSCADNPNCHFKQLARKTQECEQIKEKYEALKLENEEGYEIVAELKHECEDKQKIIDELAKEAKRISANYIKDEACYRKALEEIKGVVCDEMCDTLGHFCVSCDGKSSCITLKILDIINKAKEEE